MAKGTAKPEDATLAREHQLAEAQTFAAIGVLSSVFANDPNAPVVPWGTVSNGSDDVSKIGRLFGDTIDDGRGTGGLGLTGPGQGGGGTSNGIGLDGFAQRHRFSRSEHHCLQALCIGTPSDFRPIEKSAYCTHDSARRQLLFISNYRIERWILRLS